MGYVANQRICFVLYRIVLPLSLLAGTYLYYFYLLLALLYFTGGLSVTIKFSFFSCVASVAVFGFCACQ